MKNKFEKMSLENEEHQHKVKELHVASKNLVTEKVSSHVLPLNLTISVSINVLGNLTKQCGDTVVLGY